MNSIYQHYIIDLSSNNNFVQVPTNQGDGNNIRGFEVELIQNGLPYVVDKKDCFIFIMGTKPDTKGIMNECVLTDQGSILIDITSQMAAANGRGDYQIVLMSRSTNSQLKSFPFHIITTPSAFDIDYVTSSDEFQALTKNITRTEDVIDEANTAISDIRTLGSTIKEAEESRANAETARASAEKDRNANENTRKANETSRQTAEANRMNAENTRNSNETTRQNNESTRQADTASAITDAKNATDRANDAAERCEGIIDLGIVSRSEKGAANGVATLGSDCKIPLEQIPSVDLPVSSNVQRELDSLYQQMTAYTDQEIGDLINGAPTTLDTLGELAQAMQENQDVVTALDEAIGKKANAVEMESLLGTKADKADLGGWRIYPDELTQAQYDALPAETKSTPKMFFVILN